MESWPALPMLSILLRLCYGLWLAKRPRDGRLIRETHGRSVRGGISALYGMLFIIKLSPVLGRRNPTVYVILAIKDELEQMHMRRAISISNKVITFSTLNHTHSGRPSY